MARPGLRRVLRMVLIGGLVLFVAIQIVPYGWWHENPPIVQAAVWPDAESEAIARAACYDCHSNEVEWPFYSYVAPISWLVRHDVEEGRHELNFSDWRPGDAGESIESVQEDEMPPGIYTVTHRDAILSDAQIDTLVAALRAMGGGAGGGEHGDDD